MYQSEFPSPIEGRLDIVGLSFRCCIHRPKVYNPPRVTVLFRNNVHTRAPRDRSIGWYPLQYPQSDIPLNILLYFVLPMGWYCGRSMYSYWLNPLLHQETHRGHPLHHGQGLMLTCIKSTTGIVV